MSFSKKGNPGENLLVYLERRLDNAIFRAGFAPTTIPAARQLIVHGHVRVNGQRVNKPSFFVKQGMEFSLSEKASKFAHVEASLEAPSIVRPDWLGVDVAKKTANVTTLPTPDSVPLPIEINHINGILLQVINGISFRDISIILDKKKGEAFGFLPSFF